MRGAQFSGSMQLIMPADTASTSLSPRTLLIAVLFGLACALALNIPSFVAMYEGTFALAHLGLQVKGSGDEAYYAALIRDVAEGFIGIGNVSSFEHRYAQSVIGYAPLLQGALLWLLGWQVITAVFMGDLLFPFLAGFITYLLMRRCETDELTAFLGAAAIIAWKGGGWLRTFSPQITGVLFLGALLTVFFVGRKSAAVRGVLIGALLVTQPTYAAFLLIAEGLFFCVRWKKENFLSAIRAHAPVIIIVLVVIMLRLFLAVSDPDALALADTYRRLGLIPSHLPTAPRLQIIVVVVFLIQQTVAWRFLASSRIDRIVLPVLLSTSLLALWISLFLGVDGNFGLYYDFPIRCILWLTVFRTMYLVLPKWPRVIASAVLAFIFILIAGRQMPQPETIVPSVSDLEQVLSSLTASEPLRIVAAPLEVSNFVPVFTPHYTLFTQYAHYQYATDRELAERYLTLHGLFPLDPMYTVEGDPLVFGLYAGNLSARTRTWCRLLVTAKLSDGPCNQRLEDFIYHQDVREFMDVGTVDTVAMLRKYAVNTIITEKPLPPHVASSCTTLTQSAPYTIYDCDFDR